MAFLIIRITREQRRILSREARKRSTTKKRETTTSVVRAWIDKLGKGQKS